MASTEKKFGLPPSRRIKKSSDFQEILSRRDAGVLRAKNLYFESKLVPSKGSSLRFGFTVAKKKAKRAVDRVLVKRIMRESARTLAPLFYDASRQNECGVDISLRLLGDFRTISKDKSLKEIKAELRSEIDKLLMKLLKRLEGKRKVKEND